MNREAHHFQAYCNQVDNLLGKLKIQVKARFMIEPENIDESDIEAIYSTMKVIHKINHYWEIRKWRNLKQ